MRRIGEIRRANFLERRSGPIRGLEGLHINEYVLFSPLKPRCPEGAKVFSEYASARPDLRTQRLGKDALPLPPPATSLSPAW